MNRESRDKRSQRGRIAQLRARKEFRRNVGRALLRALGWIGVAILYYALISSLFDTPYEYSIKRSTERLRTEYQALKSRYDSLDMVLSNIEQRDKNIFNIMFESEPYSFESESYERVIALQESMLNKTTSELRRELNDRVNQLEKNIHKLEDSTIAMVENLEANSDKANKIPSIQPINNRQLTLLTASYGDKIHPFYKTMHPHQGVDFTVPEGRRVFATADGVIKSYTLSSTSGKTVVIDHGNGYETAYHHLSKIDIPRNRIVKRGDIIGLSGNTGLSLSPHLHYEVRYDGIRVDPIHYFFMELTPQEYSRILKIAEAGMQSFD